MKITGYKNTFSLLTLLSFLSNNIHGQFDTSATPNESISVKDGFEVELLFTVPKEKLGSWVNLCLDNKNRIIDIDKFV